MDSITTSDYVVAGLIVTALVPIAAALKSLGKTIYTRLIDEIKQAREESTEARKEYKESVEKFTEVIKKSVANEAIQTEIMKDIKDTNNKTLDKIMKL
jgi:hypothetical protein